MPLHGDGGGGGYFGGASVTIIPVRGTGLAGDPQTVYFHDYKYRPNATPIYFPFVMGAGAAWVRIKRISVQYDSSTDTTVGRVIYPYLNVTNAGTAGFSDPRILLGKHLVTMYTFDECVWEQGPFGFLFVLPPLTESIGTPDINMGLQVTGIAATDNLRLFMEYEWGVWPE